MALDKQDAVLLNGVLKELKNNKVTSAQVDAEVIAFAKWADRSNPKNMELKKYIRSNPKYTMEELYAHYKQLKVNGSNGTSNGTES